MAVITFTSTYDEYRKMEERYGEGHNRKCIDGKITGCGKCVGYCKYAGHPGFLTEQQRSDHNCIAHDCNYYLPKPEKIRNIPGTADPSKMLLKLASREVADMEGLKITRIWNRNGSWIANYVTISNGYHLEQAEKNVRSRTGFDFSFHKLNFDFDTCVQIVMGV